MMITNVRGLDAGQTLVAATIDGVDYPELMLGAPAWLPMAVAAWIAAGGVTVPYVAPVADIEVANYQIRAALIGAGLFDPVNTYIMALPPADLARQGWEYGNTFLRASPFVTSLTPLLAQLLAITVEQASAKLDELFAAAIGITG